MDSTTARCREWMTVRGDDLVTQVRRLVDAGDVRRIAIRTERGRTLIEVPGLLGCQSDVLEPVWRALDALGQGAVTWTVVAEREPGWPTASGRTGQAMRSAANS